LAAGLQYASPLDAMNKKSPSKTAPPVAPSQRPPASRGSRNPQLNRQTRQVLAQHYRAKYGVK
jgi:hypothetical protein